MLINPKFASLLARGGVYLEATKGEGDDLGGGSEAEKAAAEKAAAEKAKKEAEDKEAADAEAKRKAEEENANKHKPSDEEARLLKEVMKRKESEKSLQEQLAKQAESLKAFEGLDPVAIRKLLDDQKAAETKALEDKGEWDRLKVRMGEEHTAAVGKLNDQIKALQDEVTKRDNHINELTVGGSFSGSEFINKELTLTPSKARVIYGGHFELNEDGVVVGYDKPKGAANRTALVDSLGNPVAFDAALRKIVEADSDKDHLLKSGVKTGASSTTTPAKGKGKDEQGAPSSMDKILGGVAALLKPADK